MEPLVLSQEQKAKLLEMASNIALDDLKLWSKFAQKNDYKNKTNDHHFLTTELANTIYDAHFSKGDMDGYDNAFALLNWHYDETPVYYGADSQRIDSSESDDVSDFEKAEALKKAYQDFNTPEGFKKSFEVVQWVDDRLAQYHENYEARTAQNNRDGHKLIDAYVASNAAILPNEIEQLQKWKNTHSVALPEDKDTTPVALSEAAQKENNALIKKEQKAIKALIDSTKEISGENTAEPVSDSEIPGVLANALKIFETQQARQKTLGVVHDSENVLRIEDTGCDIIGAYSKLHKKTKSITLLNEIEHVISIQESLLPDVGKPYPSIMDSRRILVRGFTEHNTPETRARAEALKQLRKNEIEQKKQTLAQSVQKPIMVERKSPLRERRTEMYRYEQGIKENTLESLTAAHEILKTRYFRIQAEAERASTAHIVTQPHAEPEIADTIITDAQIDVVREADTVIDSFVKLNTKESLTKAISVVYWQYGSVEKGSAIEQEIVKNADKVVTALKGLNTPESWSQGITLKDWQNHKYPEDSLGFKQTLAEKNTMVQQNPYGSAALIIAGFLQNSTLASKQVAQDVPEQEETLLHRFEESMHKVPVDDHNKIIHMRPMVVLAK